MVYTKKTDYDGQMIQAMDKWLLDGGLLELFGNKDKKDK